MAAVPTKGCSPRSGEAARRPVQNGLVMSRASIWNCALPALVSALAIAGAPLAIATASPTIATGPTIQFGPRTKASGCTRGPDPDRRCSPGAYYRALAKRVLCSASFRTGQVRDVSETTRHEIEVEYGMPARNYGRSLEIDHIVALELGGSNDESNLFPEGRQAHPGYTAKDRLENRAHDLVCAGAIRLRVAQRRMATDWIAFYVQVFGVAPSRATRTGESLPATSGAVDGR